MKKLTMTELKALFDPCVHDSLDRAAALPGTDGLIVFECLDMCASQLGQRTAVSFGPGRTFKTLSEVEGKWLGDLPSQRKHPTAYALRGA